MIWRVVPVSYWAVVWFIRLCMRVYLRGWTVEGYENVPKTGGAILVSNHLNNADPCIIPGVFKRRMITMAKKEMFKWPVINLLFRFIGAFPVDRQGADLGALREAQSVLHDGILLLMFPEGTRSRDRQLHKGFAGSALIAYRTGAPIIPVAIWGTVATRTVTESASSKWSRTGRAPRHRGRMRMASSRAVRSKTPTAPAS